MKIRHTTGGMADKIEINMTPMIDIVFQLLAFFIMSLKIATIEGDFNIKMPLEAPQAGPPSDLQVPPMKVRLQATANGELRSIHVNERQMTDWNALHRFLIGHVGDDRGPDSIAATQEVELDCDYRLKYRNVVDAITNISGYKDSRGKTVKLIEKIKFSPPKNPPAEAGS